MVRLGFERQWRFSGSCARHAIRHALLCLGQSPSEKELSDAIGKSRITTELNGIDEDTIKETIVRLKWNYNEIYVPSADVMHKQIDQSLTQGFPVIVCVDKWNHWALLCGKNKGEYIIADSDKKKVIVASGWSTIEKRMECEDEDKPFYAIALRPVLSRPTHSMVQRVNDVLGDLGVKRRRHQWGEALLLLSRVFAGGESSSDEFFAKQRKQMLSRLSDKRDIANLSWLERMAKAYGLRLKHSHFSESSATILRRISSLRRA